MPALLTPLTTLGWSLLDSIWQMAVLWAFYYLLTAGNKRFSAAIRHDLGFLFIFLATAWFGYDLFISASSRYDYEFKGFIPVSSLANQWMPILSLIYLSVMMGRVCHHVIHQFRYTQFYGTSYAGKEIMDFVEIHSKRLQIRKRIPVFLSASAETAETSGFLKPFILLPLNLITRLNTPQLEAILIHELYHIRRKDWLFNIILIGFNCIFFFNPFARLFCKMIAREREMACDDGVLLQGYKPELYAEALYRLEKLRQPSQGLALAVDGNKPWLLMDRICRLLGKSISVRKKFNPLILFSLTAAFLIFCLQTDQSPVQLVPGISAVQSVGSHIRYDYKVEHKLMGKKIVVPPPISVKTATKKIIKTELVKTSVPEKSGPEIRTDEAYHFAENKIIRNYSNQPATGTNEDLHGQIPGAPYVPSVSLTYEALPEILSADSLHKTELENHLKNVITVYRLKTENELKELEKDLEKNQQEIRLMEMKNQHLFLGEEKNSEKLLKNIKLKLNRNRDKIEQLRINLQITGEEIIHI